MLIFPFDLLLQIAELEKMTEGIDSESTLVRTIVAGGILAVTMIKIMYHFKKPDIAASNGNNGKKNGESMKVDMEISKDRITYLFDAIEKLEISHNDVIRRVDQIRTDLTNMRSDFENFVNRRRMFD